MSGRGGKGGGKRGPFSLRTIVTLQNRVDAVGRHHDVYFSSDELAIIAYALGVLSMERVAAGERLTAEDDAAMAAERERARLEALDDDDDDEMAAASAAFDRAVVWDGGPVVELPPFPFTAEQAWQRSGLTCATAAKWSFLCGYGMARRAGATHADTCRRCGECQGQPHHWLTSMPECHDEGPVVPCKHCPARADLCSRCGEGAVWPPRDDGWCEGCRDAMLDQLDEELCSLLHRGDELGEHSPETHLALARARRGDGPLPPFGAPYPPSFAQQMDVFDVMLASYLVTLPTPPASPGRLLRDISVLELMEWHGARAREAAVAGEPPPFDPPGDSPVELWIEWCSRDVSDDDDGWATFTNRVHAMLERRGRKP